MAPQDTQTDHLLTHATESRCACCPPDRVCAWACVQGTGIEDIVIGAMLEQTLDWAQENTEPGQETIHRALMETYR
ncbi:MAG: hypothetical protein HY866_00975 [Chloroflexi bacterium]|nr:hypothetical protein [Chloroflexota bacterium]